MDLTKFLLISFYLLCFKGILSFGKEDGKEEELDARLEMLRLHMELFNISAYIVPNEDDHQSEDLAWRDKRREYISGFTGTAGDALVTTNNATLWTDGRYILQAEEQLPSYWTVLKVQQNKPDGPMTRWIIENMPKGSIIGIDPKKITYSRWQQLNDSLRKHDIKIVALEKNLVDLIWENQPQYSKKHLFIHDLKYCGESYERKLQRLREKINETTSDVMVVTMLDEIAWLFNLRGRDQPVSPLFMSYALIGKDFATLYTDEDKITTLIKEYLRKPNAEVMIKPYNEFWNDLRNISDTSKIFIPSSSNYAVHLMVPKGKFETGRSPLIDMKAEKNKIEVKGSRKAHIRDSIAICALFSKMEEEIPKDIPWDEIKVAKILDQFRKLYGKDLYKGPSFNTSAAFGSHGAMPHYVSRPQTNVTINSSAALTLDTGGQYLDGTTDITRVLHFGSPTEFQKTIYTTLLQGVIDLADTVFPTGIASHALEIVIRRPLFKLGLTFAHGTTHGTGIFSKVHEVYNGTYFENFIGSQEPGYYLKDKIGMRLENLVVVIEAPVQNDANPKKLLTFFPLTLVPYEMKLINPCLLDFRQISWLNNYHARVLKEVGGEMANNGYDELHKWLVEKTKSVKGCQLK